MNNVKRFDSFDEKKETQNYMFFSNLENLKKMVDELSTMDQDTIDRLLSEHDWASDHMSVATENIEHLYNFFSGMK
jgi:glutaredoxin 2